MGAQEDLQADEGSRDAAQAASHRAPVTRHPAPSWPALAALKLILLAAFLLTAYLASQSLRGAAVAGCGEGSGCESVLQSQYARSWNVPVSLPAAATYACLLLLTFGIGPNMSLAVRRRCWLLLLPGAMLIAAAALWFIALQYLVLHAVCRWCLASHVLGLTAAGLLLWHAPVGPRSLAPDDPPDPLMIEPATMRWLALPVAVLLALLVVGQLVSKPAATTRATVTPVLGGAGDADRGQGDSRELYVLGGAVRVLPSQFPMLGSASASRLLLYSFDYTCPHCRRTHQHLQAGMRQHSDWAIVFLPAPLNKACNPAVQRDEPAHGSACELARLALAVWVGDPARFEEFDQWMMQGGEPPSVDAAKAKAEKLLGRETLAKALADPRVDATLQRGVKFYEIASRHTQWFGLPKLVWVGGMFEGSDPDQATYLAKLQAALGTAVPAINPPSK